MRNYNLAVRVYYEDTDSGGVVYYANYLKFMERARTEWLRSFGVEQDSLVAEHGVLFAVRSASVDYLSPARFNDLLDVSVEIERIGRASITFNQRVTRGEQLLCHGTVKVAAIDAATFRPTPIPPTLLERSTEGLQ